MNDRLQRKCVIGSSLLHGLLVFVLFFGAAFSGEKPLTQKDVINVVNPDAPVTDAKSGGNSPPMAQPVQQPAPPVPVRVDPPPPVRPPDPVPVVKPVVTPAPEVKPTVEETKEKLDVAERGALSVKEPPKKPKKPTVNVSLTKVDLTASNRAKQEELRKQDREEALQAQRDATAAHNKMMSALRNTGKSLAGAVSAATSSASVIDMDIGEGGGQAFANYRDHVYSAYRAAWIAPEEVSGDRASVVVKIVVSRNGSIISADISKRSGQAPFDGSIERALRKVTKLPAFPEGTKDLQRTFQIRYNLNANQGLG